MTTNNGILVHSKPPHQSCFPRGKAQIAKNVAFALVAITAIGALIAGVLAMLNVFAIGGIGAIGSQALTYGGAGSFFLTLLAKVIDYYGCSSKKSNTKLKTTLPAEPIKIDSSSSEPLIKPVKHDPVFITGIVGSLPPKTSPKKKEKEKEIVKKEEVKGPFDPLGLFDVVPPKKEETTSSEKPELSVEEKKELKSARRALKEVKIMLGSINLRKINYELLEAAEIKLREDPNIKKIILGHPVIKETPNPDDPYHRILNTCSDLQGRIESFRSFGAKVIGIDMEGKVPVEDDGNCLFASFLVHSKIEKGSMIYNKEAVAKERRETVKWMKENYETDKTLQQLLVNSIYEHYERIQNNLKSEEAELRTTLSLASEYGLIESQIKDTKKRLKQIPGALEEIEEILIPAIIEANGIEGKELNFKPLVPFVPGYLAQMKVSGVFGGAAELYALSCRHKKAVIIHKPTGEEGEFKAEKPIHSEFEENGVIHFQLTRKHYTPYFPKG